MPIVNRAIAEQAFRAAGFKRPFTDADFAVAQQHGTGIYAASANNIKKLQSQPPSLQAQIEAGQQQYNQTQQAQVQVPTLVQNGLSEKSPEFALPRAALEERYGNPQSPLYIQNPFVRQAVIEKATSSQKAAFTTVADKVNQALALRGTIQQQDLSGLKDKYGLLQAQQKAEADAKQQQFDNMIKLQQLAIDRAKIGNGTETSRSAKNYADLIASGQMTIAQVPAAERGSVVDYVQNNGIDILPPKVRDSLGAVNAARGVLDQIKQYSSQLNTGGAATASITGAISALKGKAGSGSTKAQASTALHDISQALVSTLSRALGEKGVLTDYDVKRARALIPTPYDTKVNANRKINQLETFFSGLEKRAYETATGSPDKLGIGNSDNSGTTSSGLKYTITP